MRPFRIILIIAAISTLIGSSCEKEEVDARDKYVGTFKMTEDCLGTGPNNVTISKGSGNNDLVITGSKLFSVLGMNRVYATLVDGGFEFEEDYGPTYYKGYWFSGTVFGEGKLVGKQLTIDLLFLDDDGTEVDCAIAGVK